MQGAVLAEAVIHLHPEDVVAGLHGLHQSIEGGVCAIMLCDLHPVQGDAGAEAHPTEHKADIALALHRLLIHSAALIIVQRRDQLPDGGHKGLHGRHVLIQERQRPQGGRGAHRANMMGREKALHAQSFLSNDRFLPLYHSQSGMAIAPCPEKNWLRMQPSVRPDRLLGVKYFTGDPREADP